jgi:hypothetical protein
MQLLDTKSEAQTPRNDRAKYLDLLRQKQRLLQVVPTNEMQEKLVKEKIQYIERLIPLYQKKLGLKTSK